MNPRNPLSPSLRFAANLSLLFNEWPLLDRFAAARDAGFAAVEIQFPYDEDPDALQRAVSQAGVSTVLINAPVLADIHPFGLAGRPELTGLFRTNLQRTLEYAQALGARMVNVLAGCEQNPTNRPYCEDVLVENLLRADEVLRPAGIEVTLEVLNGCDVPGYLLTSYEHADLILNRCAGRVGLQFDIYHAAMMGLDPAEAAARRFPSIKHVQFADAPGRHEPGTGTVRFDDALNVLLASNYTGWISAEYRPVSATLASFAWLDVWRAHYGSK
ncbi:MAG: hydroxypyruvate isomerase [Verrucomicrobia bacterium]|nr:hydroxypyruvate isomerase [Verrucomicrobiota bacterium]